MPYHGLYPVTYWNSRFNTSRATTLPLTLHHRFSISSNVAHNRYKHMIIDFRHSAIGIRFSVPIQSLHPEVHSDDSIITSGTCCNWRPLSYLVRPALALDLPTALNPAGLSDLEIDLGVGTERLSALDSLDPERYVQGTATAPDADELLPHVALSDPVSLGLPEIRFERPFLDLKPAPVTQVLRIRHRHPLGGREVLVSLAQVVVALVRSLPAFVYSISAVARSSPVLVFSSHVLGYTRDEFEPSSRAVTFSKYDWIRTLIQGRTRHHRIW